VSADRVGPRRRHPGLLGLAAVSVVLGLLGLAGLFAAVTDRATTGGNRLGTDELVEPDDLELRLASRSEDGTCGEFTDDLVTGLLAVAVAGEDAESARLETGVCLRNDGLLAGDVAVSTLDVDSRELACSSREAEVDATCGEGLEGELHDVLSVDFARCSDGALLASGPVGYLEGAPQRLLRVHPGEVREVCLRASILGWARALQSDRLTWRFAFDLTDAALGPLDCDEPQLDPEPNDLPGQALPLALGEEAVGSLCWAYAGADTDVYRFQYDGDGTFVVRLWHDTVPSGVAVYLRTPTTFLAFGRTDESQTVELSHSGPGTYEVMVYYPGNGSVSEYHLQWDVVG
jgi:hypothetical protein